LLLQRIYANCKSSDAKSKCKLETKENLNQNRKI